MTVFEIGDVVRDADGSQWVIVGRETANGEVTYNRVRVGSLAHKVIAEDLHALQAKREKM